MVPRAHLSNRPKRHLDRFSRFFVWVPNALLYNALSMGTKTTKITFSLWDFITLSEEDRAMVIGNMHKDLVKIARVVPEISSRTDRHTDVLITILRLRSRDRSNKWSTMNLGKSIYFGIKMSKVKVTSHKKQVPVWVFALL